MPHGVVGGIGKRVRAARLMRNNIADFLPNVTHLPRTRHKVPTGAMLDLAWRRS